MSFSTKEIDSVARVTVTCNYEEAGKELSARDGKGPYNAYDTDKHPFLKEEYRWIEACLKKDVPLLVVASLKGVVSGVNRAVKRG